MNPHVVKITHPSNYDKYFILRKHLPENHNLSFNNKKIGSLWSVNDVVAFNDPDLTSIYTWDYLDGNWFKENGWDLSTLFEQESPKWKQLTNVKTGEKRYWILVEDLPKTHPWFKEINAHDGTVWFSNLEWLKITSEGAVHSKGNCGWNPKESPMYAKQGWDLSPLFEGNNEKQEDEKVKALSKAQVYLPEKSDFGFDSTHDEAHDKGYKFFTNKSVLKFWPEESRYYAIGDKEGLDPIKGYNDLPDHAAQYKEDVYYHAGKGAFTTAKKNAADNGYKFFTNNYYKNKNIYFMTDEIPQDDGHTQLFDYDKLPNKPEEKKVVFELADLLTPVTNAGQTRYFIYRKNLPDPTMHPSHIAPNVDDMDVLWFASPKGRVDEPYTHEQAGWLPHHDDPIQFYTNLGWDISNLPETLNVTQDTLKPDGGFKGAWCTNQEGEKAFFIFRENLPALWKNHGIGNIGPKDIFMVEDIQLLAKSPGLIDSLEHKWSWDIADTAISYFQGIKGWDLTPLLNPQEDALPDPTGRTRRVLDLAVQFAVLNGANYVGTEHLLLALSQEKDGVAGKVFKKLEVTPEKIADTLEGVLNP